MLNDIVLKAEVTEEEKEFRMDHLQMYYGFNNIGELYINFVPVECTYYVSIIITPLIFTFFFRYSESTYR